MMIPSPRLLLALCVLSTALSFPAQARLFEPLPIPPKLAVDAPTEGLWEFTKQGFDAGLLPDLAGKSAPGRIQGKWNFVTPAELGDTFPGAGKVMSENGNPRSVVEFADLAGLGSGPFIVDVVLRWERGGGFFLRIGSPKPGKDPGTLILGVLHRGPGLFELRVPVTKADGSIGSEILKSTEIYNAAEVGPVRFNEFYTYSLVYDGQKTFRVLIDGRQVFEAALATGTYTPNANSLAVGDVASWNDQFIGEIAAVRYSRGIRQYQATTESARVFSKQSQLGWNFDAGPAESAIAAGSLPARPDDLYSAERGFGWLKPSEKGFDSWYMPGSFASNPDASLAKNEHKVVDAQGRDGLIFPQGDFFRADVPDGQYWVTVEVGNNTGLANVSSISANGKVLAESLPVNANLFGGTVSERTARGLVTVANKQGIVISGQADSPGEISLKSIGILPYAPLPMALKERKLVWVGPGAVPPGFDAVSQALAKNDPVTAATAAEQIADPFLQACALSFVLGHPKLPEAGDIQTALRVRELLIRAITAQPKNVAARWLFDSTERFRHALTVYIDERGTEVAYGSRFVLPFFSANLGLSLTPEDPEFWQGRFLAGAALWQAAVQSSMFAGPTTDEFVPGKGYRAFPAPGRYFREVIAGWPDFRIARIMLGEKLPVVSDWKAPANAPQWAALEYPLMQRILEVLAYWVDERMDARGLLGGGMGDDVEALRWWNPAVLLASDPTTIKGWRLMADTAWQSTGGKGYAQGMDDVEHSAEPTSDTLPMLGLMNFDTEQMPATLDRLTRTIGAFRDLWTGIDSQGYRMFKGHHLSATQIEREGDVPYNLRAIRPLLWAAWVARGKYPELDSAIVEYAKSWRDATMADIDGKPIGIPPMMIMPGRDKVRFATAKDWVFPGYWSYEYPSGYVSKVYELMLAGYEISGDQSFLDPVRHGLGALRTILPGDEDPKKYPRASLEWALRIGAPMIGNAGANYRLATGDESFDDVLLRFGPSLTRFQILTEKAKTKEEKAKAFDPISTQLGVCLAEMNTNPELRTSMVKSTDRIYVMGSTAISSYVTGMPMSDQDLRGNEVLWPMFSVTWEGTQGSVSALVQSASDRVLSVLLYNFADQPRALTPRLWRLKPGSYELTLVPTDTNGTASGASVSTQAVKIEKPGQQIAFALPPGTPFKLSITSK